LIFLLHCGGIEFEWRRHCRGNCHDASLEVLCAFNMQAVAEARRSMRKNGMKCPKVLCPRDMQGRAAIPHNCVAYSIDLGTVLGDRVELGGKWGRASLPKEKSVRRSCLNGCPRAHCLDRPCIPIDRLCCEPVRPGEAPVA